MTASPVKLIILKNLQGIAIIYYYYLYPFQNRHRFFLSTKFSNNYITTSEMINKNFFSQISREPYEQNYTRHT